MPGTSWKVEVLRAGDWRGATSCLLILDSHHVLVDTGSWHEDSLLAEALARRGLHPCDIDMVINTHFHIDHVMNNCMFAGSQIYAPQESYEWTCALYSDLLNEANWESLMVKYYPETFRYEHARENMGKLRRLGLRWWDRKRLGPPGQYTWLETQAPPDGLEVLKTPGHVPGHVSILVRDADPPLVIAGDALLTRDHDDRILTMIPHHRAQAQRDRALILSLPGLIIPGHDQSFLNQPGAGDNPADAAARQVAESSPRLDKNSP
jgi:glyoxylase-like metal-dependent hydrolase (beta-lactamase superfamily II)